MERKASPIVKWAGGKRQLLDELLARVPAKFNAYHEFFLGGGALFFELYNTGRIDRAVLSDINPRLINLYKVVQNQPYELIEELKDKTYANNERAFYNIRKSEPSDEVEMAARFVYLNKTAFNGLYRENSSGKFNVPFGRYKNPRILDEEGILAASEAFSKATLLCGDFSKVEDYANTGDFAYFDPPYYPLDNTASFTAYNSRSFSGFDQKRLKKTFDVLTNRGVNILLSNSHTNFITDLFSDRDIASVMANRMINCKANGRGPIREVMITSGYA